MKISFFFKLIKITLICENKVLLNHHLQVDFIVKFIRKLVWLFLQFFVKSSAEKLIQLIN